MRSGTAEARPTNPKAFVKMPVWIGESDEITADEKHALELLLHDDYRKKNPPPPPERYAPPTLVLFARWIGSNRLNEDGKCLPASRPTVIRAIEGLEDLGFLRVNRRLGVRNSYDVDLAAVAAGQLGPVKRRDRLPVNSVDRSDPKPVKRVDTVKTTVRPPVKDSSPSAKPTQISNCALRGADEQTHSTSGHDDVPEADVIDDPATSTLDDPNAMQRLELLAESWPEEKRQRLLDGFRVDPGLGLHLAATRTCDELLALVPRPFDPERDF
jgi:hypothetical protein